MAKVVLSFDDWKEGHVAPAKVQVPVLDASSNRNGKQ
jgi:hypothetical protein